MKYDNEFLEQINLHSLRCIAREVGVKSPTTFNKKDLINEIEQILSGKKPPHETKKGRPLKKNIDFNSIEKEETEQEKKMQKQELINIILKKLEITLDEIL